MQGIHRSPVNSPHRVQWRRALMFTLIFAWTNNWVNNRDAGDLRHDRAHYDVTVMVRDWALHGNVSDSNKQRSWWNLVNLSPIHALQWRHNWARWRLKAPASRLFTQSFIQAQIKENIKAPRHWPLWGEFTGDQWIPRKKASNTENVSIWWRHPVNFMRLSLRENSVVIRW